MRSYEFRQWEAAAKGLPGDGNASVGLERWVTITDGAKVQRWRDAPGYAWRRVARPGWLEWLRGITYAAKLCQALDAMERLAAHWNRHTTAEDQARTAKKMEAERKRARRKR